jgi:hypothetical protein
MPISNYAELQAKVAAWNHRDLDEIHDFITLAEERINSDLAARLSEVETQLIATPGSRFIPLPPGYISNRGLWMTTYGSRIEVLYVIPEMLPVTDSIGQPRYYTIDGANIAFEYPCDQIHTYDFRYKKGFDIAATLTNDILTRFPGVYLFGALMEAALYARDYDILDKWSARYYVALSGAQNSEFENKTQAFLPVDSTLSQGRQSNIIAGDF